MHQIRYKEHGDPLGGRTPNGEARKFLEDVAMRYRGDDCLIWPYIRNKKGYAMLGKKGGGLVMAHRVICEKIHGPPPSEHHQTGHSCGNGWGGCVNSRHLRWVTPKENSMDRIKHGTQVRGESCSYSKLTEEDVLEIRKLHPGFSYSKLAKLYNVSVGCIGRIIRKENWRHILP